MARTEPQSDRVAAAWAAHADSRAQAVTAGDFDVVKLLDARAAVADRYPGCATAILSPNPTLNWDRGAVVRAELEKPAKSG